MYGLYQAGDFVLSSLADSSFIIIDDRGSAENLGDGGPVVWRGGA
jgi:hypothetical protein